MITAVVVLTLGLALIAYPLVRNRKLRKEIGTLRQKLEAWKTYAITVETTYETRSEVRDSPHFKKTVTQFRAAEEAAMDALTDLKELGEYPDAEECSPFSGIAETAAWERLPSSKEKP